MNLRTHISRAARTMLGMLALGACAASNGGASTASNAALSAAVDTATTSAGALACAPDATQVAACSGKAAGDPCTATIGDQSVDGSCRASIDGSVGCAPSPPPPPAAAVAACTGKAAGDACAIADADDDDAGACKLAADGATLACARTFTPPAGAVAACSGKASGDACTMPGHEGESLQGSCSAGPSGSDSLLACRPAGRFPDAAAACSGLAAGASCTMSAGHDHGDGTCAAEPSGSVVCVLPCGEHQGAHGGGPGDRAHDGGPGDRGPDDGGSHRGPGDGPHGGH